MDVKLVDAARALLRLGGEAEIELFNHHPERTPLGMVLYRARRDAIRALGDLVSVPFADGDNVRILQNEVRRYLDMLTYVSDMLHAGESAASELEPHEQDEVRRALGLSPGADDE